MKFIKLARSYYEIMNILDCSKKSEEEIEGYQELYDSVRKALIAPHHSFFQLDDYDKNEAKAVVLQALEDFYNAY